MRSPVPGRRTGEIKTGTTLVEVALDTASDPGSIPGASTRLGIRNTACGAHLTPALTLTGSKDGGTRPTLAVPRYELTVSATE